MKEHSPLALVMRAPEVNQLVGYLSAMARQIEGRPLHDHVLRFSRVGLEAVRESYRAAILRGEIRLHRLSGLLCDQLCPGEMEIRSVVVGETKGDNRRFTLSQPVAVERLYGLTDLDLGNSILDNVRWRRSEQWVKAELVANFVEYQPLRQNACGIHKMLSRIKAEEEIWNKVTDEIFQIDQLISRDKKLQSLSRYVKDVFGLKLVVSDEAEARALAARLAELRFDRETLELLDVPFDPLTERLHVLETKDYLGGAERKQSGWEAWKMVVAWWDSIFEIQIQPQLNYFLEREKLTTESHAGFRQRREKLREDIARTIPLFQFYQALLRWLFSSGGEGEPPRHSRVHIDLSP